MRPPRRQLIRVAALILLAGGAAAPGTARGADARADALAAATLVLYNASDPASMTMARYYALKRSIPDDQVVGLACEPVEEISREAFETDIVAPLRALFARRGWWTVGDVGANGLMATRNTIRFVAIMRGFPLKVRPRQLVPQGGPTPRPVPGLTPRGSPTPTPAPPAPMERQEASVDSELAALGILSKPLEGVVPNAYYKSYTPILDADMAPLMLVCRLDGPNLGTVRRMIDDALAAESEGVGGVAYFDIRNLRRGNYVAGDRWIRSAAADFQRHGVPTVMDWRADTLPSGYPAEDAGFYFGWYTEHADGPFADPDFRFRRGAVAVHIHSFSAATVRNPTRYWCAPLLERGAAATLGNVYEPYLDFTAHLDIFADRLLAGFTLAESAYMAQRAISWMTTVLGDPLYRPFARWSDLDRPRSGSGDAAVWDAHRSAILAWKEAGLGKPSDLPGDAAARARHLESMAFMLWFEGRRDRALAVLRQAGDTYPEAADRIRVAYHAAQMMRRRDNKDAVIRHLQNAMREYAGHPGVKALAAHERELNPPPPPSPSPKPKPKPD